MTKAEAVYAFRKYVMPTIWVIEQRQCGRKDLPLRDQAWNDYTDRLCKDGRITDWQYNNWTHPRPMRRSCATDLIAFMKA